MNREKMGYQINEEPQDNVVSTNLSELFKLKLFTEFGEHIIDFNEDFMLSKENFDDVGDSELNNILSRLPSRRVILNSAIFFGHQSIHQQELVLKEIEALAEKTAREVIQTRKSQMAAEGKISKSSSTVTNSEINSHIWTVGSHKDSLHETTSVLNALKADTKFLEMFDKIIESRVMILLHLSKKRSGVV